MSSVSDIIRLACKMTAVATAFAMVHLVLHADIDRAFAADAAQAAVGNTTGAEGGDQAVEEGPQEVQGAASDAQAGSEVGLEGEVEENQAGTVKLTFPPNVELEVLVEYVAQRLDLNILHDDQLANRRITLKAQREIPVHALMDLLQSALQVNGLTLIEDKRTGWLRIAETQNLQAISGRAERRAEAEADPEAAAVLTTIFDLEHAAPEAVRSLVRPFLSQPGGNMLTVDGKDVVVVTDFTSNMDRIARLIELADQPPGEVAMEFVRAEHQRAPELAEHAERLLQAKAQTRGRDRGRRVQMLHDERTNQVIAIGDPRHVEEALEVLESLDVSLGLETRVYRLQVTEPSRIDRLVRELVAPDEIERRYRSTMDPEARLLIATATPAIHERLASLKESLDVPMAEVESPVRFYKLQNTSAVDVLQTLSALEGQRGFQGLDTQTLTSEEAESAQTDPEASAEPDEAAAESEADAEDTSPDRRLAPRDPDSRRGRALDEVRQQLGPGEHRAVQTEEATVVVDENTNSLIVVAAPEIQEIYAQLIEQLDRRRPQVLIQATVVTVDTSDSFSLGVDLAAQGDFEVGGRAAEGLAFSSFGLSAVDEDTGRLSLAPGLGFNGAILSPELADVVLRALQTHARARVASAPRVLVNDNATGRINSINEAPFTSINVSDQIATTSFGGFVEAGTDILVRPQIAEGDHLRLEFDIALNSFTGDPGDDLPPPRQTNSVSSEVRVPDGHTIIVGGINRTDLTRTVESIPLLGDIPLLKHLFRSESTSDSETTLFVFIRPLILRDDEFRDLKHLSRRELEDAGMQRDYPSSDPMLMR